MFYLFSKAQNFPIFSQYVSNGLILNPAYTASREVLSINFLYRDQWSGFQGAPVFETFTAHAPLKNAHVGLGLLVMNEQSGPFRNTHIYLNYAYRVNIGKSKLAFGLKAGINLANYDWKNIYINDHPDPVFDNNNNDSFTLPNFGVGIYYYSKKMFTGLSVPYLLSYKKNNSERNYGIYHDINNYNYLFTAGYLFDFTKNFKIKPTVLLKYNIIIKQQVDLNLSFILLNNKLLFGTAYRLSEAIAGSFEIQLNPQLRLGYTYDYPSGNVKYFNFVSHEFSVRYEFSYKIKAINPRFF